MDEDRGWLEEVFNDVNEDVKSWPEWLKDEDFEGQARRRCVGEKTPRDTANQKNRIFD